METNAKNALAVINEIDAERRKLGGERYKQESVLLEGVTGTLESTAIGKVLITQIEGKAVRIPLHRTANETAKSFNIAVMVAPKEFNYRDAADNIVTVPAGTRKYVAL